MMTRLLQTSFLLAALVGGAAFSNASSTPRGYYLRPQFELADCEAHLIKQGAQGIRKKAQKWFSQMSPRTLSVGALPIVRTGGYHPRDRFPGFAIFELPLDAHEDEIERAYKEGQRHVDQIDADEPDSVNLIEGPETLSPLEHVALGLPFKPGRKKAELQAFLRQPSPGRLQLSTLTSSGEAGEVEFDLTDLRIGFHNYLMIWQFEELRFQGSLFGFEGLYNKPALPLSKDRFLVNHGELILLKNEPVPLAYTISREVLEDSPHGSQGSFLTIKIYTTRPCKREPLEGELVLPQTNQPSRLCFTELPIVIFSTADFKQAKGQYGFDLTDDDFK